MAPELQVRIGPRVVLARKAAGLSQQALASKIGAHPRTVQTWEANVRTPHAIHLARLAAATGRPASWFYETDEVAA